MYLTSGRGVSNDIDKKIHAPGDRTASFLQSVIVAAAVQLLNNYFLLHPREVGKLRTFAVRSTGARIVEVENKEQLQCAAGPGTAMMYYPGVESHDWEWETPVILEECLAIARRAGFPVLVDDENNFRHGRTFANSPPRASI